MYLDGNSLYGWAMSRKLPVDGFKWKKDTSKFNEDFIKNCDEDSDKGFIIQVDVEYPKEGLFNKHKDLAFLPKNMKPKLNGPDKLACNIYNKKNYVVHIRALKKALNHRLIMKKVHRVIEINQEAWLKPHIKINTKLRTKSKNDFEKISSN